MLEALAQPARGNPDALVHAPERKTGKRQDPCVRDTFAVAIHLARTVEAPLVDLHARAQAPPGGTKPEDRRPTRALRSSHSGADSGTAIA